MNRNEKGPLLSRRQFINLGSIGLLLMSSGCTNVKPFLKTAAEQAAGYAAVEIVESEAERLLQNKYREKTRLLNQETKLNLPKGGNLRYSIHLGKLSGGFGFSGFEEDLVTDMLAHYLGQTLGGIVVAPLDGIRQETDERGYLRGNEEINQKTVSPKETIIREGAGGVGIITHLKFIQAQQAISGSDFREIDNLFHRAGIDFDISWVKTIVSGSLKFQDKDTLVGKGTVRMMGIATDLTDFNLEIFSDRLGILIQRRQDQEEEKRLAALDSALKNAMSVIREKIGSKF